jgi:hypothetical protein
VLDVGFDIAKQLQSLVDIRGRLLQRRQERIRLLQHVRHFGVWWLLRGTWMSAMFTEVIQALLGWVALELPWSQSPQIALTTVRALP